MQIFIFKFLLGSGTEPSPPSVTSLNYCDNYNLIFYPPFLKGDFKNPSAIFLYHFAIKRH